MAKARTARYERSSSSSRLHVCLLLALLLIILVALLIVFFPLSSQNILHSRPNLPKNSSLFTPNIYMRLPTNLRPVHYDLRLQLFLPYMESLNFGANNYTTNGSVRIRFECIQDTDKVVLNAKNLTFKMREVEVSGEYGEHISITAMNRYRLRAGDVFIHVFELFTAVTLQSGHNYTLHVKYRGLISDVFAGGLYKASYDIDGVTRTLASTQLQPTDASRLLPCFDEPAMKARFHIVIVHPAGTSAISNSPVRHFRNISSKWSETEFETTPTMSTYLIAVAVSDFVFRSTFCRNIQIRVWSQPSKLPDTHYALNIVCRLLLYYEDFFSIPYPLRKLDIFAVPELRVLAMENWGLIIVRQKLVIYNERMNSLRDRRSVTDVLAHEIAHMWFGNLVTMRWWNDLWLNEGFATMMAPKAADYAENMTLRMSQYFCADVSLKALSGDQHASLTQPISLKKNSDRVYGQDNKILYLKGATVLRMVESTLGEDVFRRGLHPYIWKFAYSNAEKDDFLGSFCQIFNESTHREDAFVFTNFSVSDFMDSWIYQAGFPVIEVRRQDRDFVIAQRIFDDDNSEILAKQQWKVPVFVGREKSRRVIWLCEGQTVQIENSDRPFVIDIDSHGYYRVQYDVETWNEIIELLITNFTALPTAARLRLLDDAFVLAEDGHVPYSIPLRMSEYLRTETEAVPFRSFLTRIEAIQQRVHHLLNSTIMNKYIQYILEPVFYRILFENEIEKTEKVMEKEYLRELVLLKLCASGHHTCIDRIRPIFVELLKNCSNELFSNSCNRVEASIRSVVYMVGIKFGNLSDFEFLKKKYETEEYHAERDRLFSALAFTTDHSKVVSLMSDALAVKERDTDFRQKVYELVRKNFDNDVVSDYLRYNYNEIRKKHEKYEQFFILQMARMYGTERDLEKLIDFEKVHSVSLSKRNRNLLAFAMDEVRRKIAWSNRYATQIVQFFSSFA